ncbi:phage adaptor protein [Methylobacterium sp. JK268]
MSLPSITDYSSLVTNLSDYLARNDLEDYYPTFIELAEKRLNSALKALGMQSTNALAPGADGNCALPTDYVEWVSVVWTPSSGGRSLGLRYAEPNAPEVTNRFRPNGPPQFYTIAGGKLQPQPPRAGSYALTYYQRIPPLTAAATTNWLIGTAPQVYLYAVLAEAYAFQKDEEKASLWTKAAEERLAQFMAESSSGKVGRRAERDAEQAAEMVAAKAIS